jgi:hypothetical protein
LKLVELTLGQVISEPGRELEYAYFPLTAVASLLCVMNDGESAEIALVGNDGMLGITFFMGDDDMVMTQKLISKMLGVKIDEVTGAAQALSASGAITYQDGRITLLDRAVLEGSSCECYEVVKQECDRLLPPAPRTTS